MMTPRERYQNDPEFHTLVDTIFMTIERCQYTPTELREAVMLAAIMHEEKCPFPKMTTGWKHWYKKPDGG